VSRRAAGLGAVGLTVLAVAMTWPIATELSTHVLFSFDVDLTVWIVTWVARTVVTAPTQLFQGNIFHPAPDALAYSEHMLGALPVTLPAYWATGDPIFTHQLLLLATFVLSALAMAALVRFWTGSEVGAFVGGALFAFARWRFLRLYWVQVLLTFYAPLVVLFSSRYLCAGRRRDLVVAGASFLGQALSSYALCYPMCAALAVFWPIHAFVLRASFRRLLALLTMTMAVGLVLVFVSVPVMRVQDRGVADEDPNWKPASAQPMSPLRVWLDPKTTQFPGYVSYGLALGGLALLLNGRVARGWPVPGRALAVSLIGFAAPLVILGLGPRGGPVLHWLWEHVPGLRLYRVPERFGHLVSLPIAVLGGVVAAALDQRARRAGRAWTGWVAGLLLVGVFCWEVRTEWQPWMRPVALPPVYVWLEAQEHGPVLEIPTSSLRDADYVLGSAWHGLPLVNGYSGYTPAGYPLVVGLAAQLPSKEPLGTLRRLTGLRWLVVHLGFLTSAERSRWEGAGAPPPVARFGSDVVFAIAPATEDWSAHYQRPEADITLGGTPAVILGPQDTAELQWTVAGSLPAGAVAPLSVAVSNTGTQRWPALSIDPSRRVGLALQWQPAATVMPSDQPIVVPLPPIVVPLPRDLAPGETVTVNTAVATPRGPGRYDLVAQIRQGETPLRTAGGSDARIAVDVF
jgi:hypothetical protein